MSFKITRSTMFNNNEDIMLLSTYISPAIFAYRTPLFCKGVESVCAFNYYRDAKSHYKKHGHHHPIDVNVIRPDGEPHNPTD